MVGTLSRAHAYFWLTADDISNLWFPSATDAKEAAEAAGHFPDEYTVLSVKDDFDEILHNLSDGIYDDEAYLAFIEEIVGWDYLTTSYYSWDDFESSFNDSYGGEYDSPEDWAKEFINDVYGDVTSNLDIGNLSYYVTIDYAAFARDAELGGDENFVKIPGGGVYVFHANF